MTAESTPEHEPPASRRHNIRYRVHAPVDVTVLRSGVSDKVPGRVVDLGAGGLSAVLARELLLGESVGLEIDLPDAKDRLRTRALVRHHDKLRCGVEFVDLSTEQKAAIRRFTRKSKATPNPLSILQPGAPAHGRAAGKGREDGESAPPGPRPANARPANPRGRGWIFLLASVAILLAVLRWWWDRGWEDLETGLHPNAAIVKPDVTLPSEVIAKLIAHRVDPDYPQAARAGRLQGVVVVDVIIGQDGRVLNANALNGPDFFAQAATDALRWWRFEPYKVDGRPAVVETTVAVEFKP